MLEAARVSQCSPSGLDREGPVVEGQVPGFGDDTGVPKSPTQPLIRRAIELDLPPDAQLLKALKRVEFETRTPTDAKRIIQDYLSQL